MVLSCICACGSDSRGAPPDAAQVDQHLVPISVSGLTPLGSLDEFAFAEAYYDNCSERFYLDFRMTRFYDQQPHIRIWFPMPEDTTAPVTGPLNANVVAEEWNESDGWIVKGAAAITFDAAPLDPPLSSGRMSGRFTTTVPGWMLDFSVDLMFFQLAPGHGGCTL